MGAPQPSQSSSSPSHAPRTQVARKAPPGLSQRWISASSPACSARGTWMMEWKATTASKLAGSKSRLVMSALTYSPAGTCRLASSSCLAVTSTPVTAKRRASQRVARPPRSPGPARPRRREGRGSGSPTLPALSGRPRLLWPDIVRPHDRSPLLPPVCALPSTGGYAAVHDHARPDAGGRLVGGEVGGHRGYLLGGDEPFVRLAGLHVRAGLLGVVVAARDAGDPGCVHRPWRYAVDPDALLDVVYSRGPREREDRALRRAVDGPVRDPYEGRHRGHVDDRSSPRVPYGGDGAPFPPERPPHADVHHPVVVLF